MQFNKPFLSEISQEILLDFLFRGEGEGGVVILENFFLLVSEQFLGLKIFL